MTETLEELDSPVIVRDHFNRSKFDQQMDSFDDFLTMIEPEAPAPGVRILTQVIDVLDDDSFFSDDSDDEFALEERQRPSVLKNSGALEAMFQVSSPTKKVTGSPSDHHKRRSLENKGFPGDFKIDDMSKSEHGSSRAQRESLSTSDNSVNRRGNDHPSKSRQSENSSSRKSRDEMSKSEHGSRRKKDELSSKSEHGSRRKKDELSCASERVRHTAGRRSSDTTTSPSPSSKSRKALSPCPPTSRTSSNGGMTSTRRRRDELSSQSEHGRPRIRRDALYSKVSGRTGLGGKTNEMDRSRRSRSNVNLEAVAGTATRRERSSNRPSRTTSSERKPSRDPHRRRRSGSKEETHRRQRGSSVEVNQSRQTRGGSKRSGLSSSGDLTELGRGSEHHSSSMRRRASRDSLAASSIHRRSSASKHAPQEDDSGTKQMRHVRSSAAAADMVRKESRRSPMPGSLDRPKLGTRDMRVVKRSSKADSDGLIHNLKGESESNKLSKFSNAKWDLSGAAGNDCGSEEPITLKLRF